MFNLTLTLKQADLIERSIIDNLSIGYNKLTNSEIGIALNLSLYETTVNRSESELRFICDSLNRYASRYMTYEEELARECTELFNYLVAEGRGAFNVY